MPISYPITTITARSIDTTAGDAIKRDLLLGTVTQNATVTADTLYQDVETLTISEIETLFAPRSDITNKILAYRKASDLKTKLDVKLAAENATPTAATAIYTIAGTATASGSITFRSVDQKNYSVTIDVETGDTADTVGANLVTALTALDNAPFTAANVTGTVTLTSEDRSEIPNSYTIAVDGTVAGLTVTLTGWTGGAGAVDVSTILDNLDGIQYWGIQWPQAWNGDIGLLETFLTDRLAVNNRVLYGAGFMGLDDSIANISSFLSAKNNQVVVYAGSKPIDTTTKKGTHIIRPSDWLLSDFMGYRSRRSTEGTDISDIVFNAQIIEGGDNLASIPYFNTPFAEAVSGNPNEDYTLADVDTTFFNIGYTAFINNQTSTGVTISRVMTTYSQNALGEDDLTFSTLNYNDTTAEFMEIIFDNFKADYPQSRLSNGTGIVPGGVSEKTLKGAYLRYYRLAAAEGLTQEFTPSGTDALKSISDSLQISINTTTGSVIINADAYIMSQLVRATFDIGIGV